MKKQNVLNLIKYHVERNENSFRNEAIAIVRYFDSIGDYQLSEYIMGLISESNLYWACYLPLRAMVFAFSQKYFTPQKSNWKYFPTFAVQS